MPLNILYMTEKNPNQNILCLLNATECPVFEVKAKINVSAPFDAINRTKSIDFTIKQF